MILHSPNAPSRSVRSPNCPQPTCATSGAAPLVRIDEPMLRVEGSARQLKSLLNVQFIFHDFLPSMQKVANYGLLWDAFCKSSRRVAERDSEGPR